LPDPGPYTDLHREARGVFSYPYTFFEGIKLAFMRGVSQNMQVRPGAPALRDVFAEWECFSGTKIGVEGGGHPLLLLLLPPSSSCLQARGGELAVLRAAA